MDTWGPLGQALECSVCLEQLDSTSRVLPCQHTFCRKCLIDIINSRKELRCPECRVLVTVPFSSLPPNILLLRILEGIKRLPPNTSAAATASASENLLDVSSQNNSQLHKDSDPFSIFSQFPASNESAIQTSSNRDLTGSERSIHTSLNPFLEPHSNAYSSVTNIQVVPSLNNSAQNNSIISNINSLSNTLSVINSPSNVLSLLHSSGSQENSHNQLLTNKSCPSAQIISSVLSSNHALNNVARQNINLNSDYNSQTSECNIVVSSSSQVISPSMTPTPVTAPVLNNLSDFTVSARRTIVSTLTERETPSLTSNVSNNPAVESQTIETNESPQTINSEEPSRVNERTSLVSQLPSKSLRESQLTSISSQPFVSLSLNVQAKALYNYNGKEARDLKFKKGDVIKLFKQIDENWYQGELDGQVGIIPASYVKIIDPTSSHIPQCKALYDFKMPSEEERNCLMFSKGDVITILRRVDENWAEGKLNTLIGIFPLSFVELNEAAKNLIRISSSITPTVSHHHHHHHHQTAAETCSSVGTLSTISTVSSSTHTPIPSVLTPVPVHASTSQTVQASNHLNNSTQSISQGLHPLKDLQSMNRLSGTQTSTNASPSRSPSVSSDCLKRTDSSRYHSQIDTDITTRSLPTLQLYVALYSYRPRKADELELTKGFLYSVADKCLDGWFKGRCLATDKIGVFPGNYVQLANSETIATAHYPRSMTASIANYLSEIHGINFPVGNNQLKTSTSPRIHSQTGSLGDVRNLNIGVACPPELPPRSLTSSNKNIGASSTGERPSSASDSSPRISSCSSPVSQAGQQGDKKSATKDRSGTTNGSGISLMRKLTNSGKRKTKSPPFLSLDNPVFEEASNKNKNMGVEDKSCNGIAKTVKQMPAPLIRERYRCVTPYPANSEYELELQVGDIVYIHKKRDDGWFKGTLQRTGKTGLFPSIFVEPC